MGSVEDLIGELRAQAQSANDDDGEYWLKRIGPMLPPQPFAVDFIERVVAPLDALERACLMEFLADLGRAEVADFAFALASGPDDFANLGFGGALIELNDPRGCEVIERIYFAWRDKPPPPTGTWVAGKVNWIPFVWIENVLCDKRDKPAAKELLSKLGAPRMNAGIGPARDLISSPP